VREGLPNCGQRLQNQRYLFGLIYELLLPDFSFGRLSAVLGPRIEALTGQPYDYHGIAGQARRGKQNRSHASFFLAFSFGLRGLRALCVDGLAKVEVRP
jgi:hypothetical protein